MFALSDKPFIEPRARIIKRRCPLRWALAARVLGSMLCVVFLSSCSRPPTTIKEGAVQIVANPANVAVRYVDKMYFPQGTGCGRAYTYWTYDCRTQFTMKERPDLAKAGTRSFEIIAVQMDIGLEIVIRLPYFPSQKLRDHEDGHTRMCELLYKNAPQIALQCAKKMVGTVVPVTGAEAHMSLKESADRQAHLSLCKAYREQTSDIADGAGQIYDRITNHGMGTVAENQAITQAFREYFAKGKTIPAGDEGLIK